MPWVISAAAVEPAPSFMYSYLSRSNALPYWVFVITCISYDHLRYCCGSPWLTYLNKKRQSTLSKKALPIWHCSKPGKMACAVTSKQSSRGFVARSPRRSVYRITHFLQHGNIHVTAVINCTPSFIGLWIWETRWNCKCIHVDDNDNNDNNYHYY